MADTPPCLEESCSEYLSACTVLTWQAPHGPVGHFVKGDQKDLQMFQHPACPSGS